MYSLNIKIENRFSGIKILHQELVSKFHILKLFALKYQLCLLIFGLLVWVHPVRSQQSAVYFTHTKVSNLKKLVATEDFARGDTIYGVLYFVSDKSSSLTLDDFTLTENGTAFVPITVTSETGDQVSWKVELSSGLNKPKKSGLMGALNSAISDQSTEAFYFQVLPTSNDHLSMNWMKFLANLYRSSKPIKTIKVTVGTGEYFHTSSSKFTLDFSGGTEPYSNWTRPYLEEEARLKDERKTKLETDSIAKAKAAFDDTEKRFPPAYFKSKIVDAKLEKEITGYYKSLGWEVYKVCIWDAENSSTFQVFVVVKDRDNCYVLFEWLIRDNPYGDLVKFKNAQLHNRANYELSPLRCEKAQEYLK